MVKHHCPFADFKGRFMASENIAAIATGLMPAGVAVIRISGDNPLDVANKVFKPSGKTPVLQFEPYKMYTGEILAEGFTDFGMCVYFKAPKSFTGENVVELHTHGGLAITQGVLTAVLNAGARMATKGEFTKRAFINGKMSLASAEGLIDMINSESISGVKAGYSLYRERLTNLICKMQDGLTDSLAEIDADMDFPEEDLEEMSTERVHECLKNSIEKLTQLLNGYKVGRTLISGVKVGIVGKPNTGKSSLLNALLNYDKAIVSDVAGTTRDIVEGSIDINGVRFNFSDTAGIRETDGDIEKIGVQLSKKIVEQSDIIIFVLDASEVDEQDEQIYQLVKDREPMVVVNKKDKSDFTDDRADIYISAKKNENIEQLKQLLFARAVGQVDLGGEYLCEQRHFEALSRAKEKLTIAFNGLGSTPLELVAMDIKDGWDALGEISGKTASEVIINNIFAKFCVGK